MPKTRGKATTLANYASVASEFTEKKTGVGSPEGRTKPTKVQPIAPALALARTGEADPKINQSAARRLPEPPVSHKPPTEREELEVMDTDVNPEEEALLLQPTTESETRRQEIPLLEPARAPGASNGGQPEASTSGGSDAHLTEAGQALLAARKRLRKLRSQIVRVKSHLDFCKECHRMNKVPKGLKVNVRCNALLADYSNVRQKFDQTKATAEHGFRDNLEEHYEVTLDRLQGEIRDVERAAEAALERATQEERAEHMERMTTMETAVGKEEKELEDTKRRKLTALTTTNSEQRERPRGTYANRSRGGRPNRKRGRDRQTDEIVQAVLQVLEQRRSEGQPQPPLNDRETRARYQPPVTGRGRARGRGRRDFRH